VNPNIRPELLHQQWVHAYEEDTPTEVVYRPAGHPLPPARGRQGFELRPDQTVTNIGIGRTDAPEETAGSWELEEKEVPVLRITLDTGESQAMKITSVEPDRLVLEKTD
jgi:hypothetical protein